MQGLNPITMQCTYSTPCGWCTKWDKKCDKKIGCGNSGDVGQRGMIGICPDCGRSGCISWNPDTDVSSCSCGWNNDKPKRGLRANIAVYDDAMNPCVTFEPCQYCESHEYGDPKCPTCRKENYKFFKAIKEN